ncbi:MAG: acyl-CoA dehydrogenase family protein [Methylotenera sp.]|nr:acyl-CoA dehydrogenase family protein [Oligoflexia bacterium]
MSTAILNEKNMNREELESLEVAEDSREQDWLAPSFVGDIFMGKLRMKEVLPYPEPSDEERKIGDAYIAKMERFLRENLDADQVDETGEIPTHVMKGLADLGAFGMKIPKEYGGLGLSQVNYNRTLALVSGHCASTVAMLSAHQSIGVPQPLMLFGTEEQKKKYLPRLAKGAVSAFALTEPEVGSDPARMSTTATPTADGNHFIINGTKLWCTNGAIADILVVMAQTPPIMKNGREKKQITAFIVEKGMPGFEILHRCRFLGLNGVQNALMKFTDVKVPKENVIWGVGKGLRLALITLNAGRLSLPAGCIGGARQSLRVVREWGNERVQWGSPVGQHEVGAQKIASIAANLFAMEAITWLAGAWVDGKKHDIRLEAAIAKVFCSEKTQRIAEDTLQLRGGRGYERASSLRARGEKPFPVERFLRDGRINLIVEGTSEILRLFIAREALDKHLKIGGPVMNTRLSVGKRIGAAIQAAGFYATWYPAQWLGSLLGYLPMYGELGPLAKHIRYAKRASHKVARAIFHAMILNGPKLEKRQLTLSRLVEIASDIFAMAATCGRAKARMGKPGEFGNVTDIADLFCQEARVRIEANFHALHHNTDSAERRVAKQILSDQGRWLETEMVVMPDNRLPMLGTVPSSVAPAVSSMPAASGSSNGKVASAAV